MHFEELRKDDLNTLHVAGVDFDVFSNFQGQITPKSLIWTLKIVYSFESSDKTLSKKVDSLEFAWF